MLLFTFAARPLALGVQNTLSELLQHGRQFSGGAFTCKKNPPSKRRKERRGVLGRGSLSSELWLVFVLQASMMHSTGLSELPDEPTESVNWLAPML